MGRSVPNARGRPLCFQKRRSNCSRSRVAAPYRRLRDRVVLRFRQARLEDDISRRGRRQRTNQKRPFDLGSTAGSILDGHRHATFALPHAADNGAQQQRAAQPPGHDRGEPIVAFRNPEGVTLSGRSAVGELLDERKHRQVLGIREEESAKRADRRTDVRGTFRSAIQAATDSGREPPRDCTVPPIFGELEIANLFAEHLRHHSEAAGPGVNSTLPARVRSVEAKPIAKNADRRQPQIGRQLTHVGLLFLDQIGAGLGMLPTCEARPGASTHGRPRDRELQSPWLSRRAPRARAQRSSRQGPRPRQSLERRAGLLDASLKDTRWRT